MAQDRSLDQVECLICGKSLKELNFHLSKIHQLSVANYKLRFPLAKIISKLSSERKSRALSATRRSQPPRVTTAETRKKISLKSKESMAKRLADPDQLAKLQKYAANARNAKGPEYKHSDETIRKMSGPRYNVRGVAKSEEHKRKLSVARTGRKAPHSQETIEKMKAAWRRRKEDVDAYQRYRAAVSLRMSTPEMIEVVRARTAKLIKGHNHNGKSSGTSLERKMLAFLNDLSITSIHQYIVHTRKGDFTFDFYIEEANLLVEVDGEYWHAKSWEQFNRDLLKMSLAEEMGYRAVRISDKDWRPEAIFLDGAALCEHNAALLEVRRNFMILKSI